MVMRSGEFSGDRLGLRLLEAPCRICLRVWDRKAGTCQKLQMDSEQTDFLKSPGRTMVLTGTGRSQNVISFSHPRDRPAYGRMIIVLLWNKQCV